MNKRNGWIVFAALAFIILVPAVTVLRVTANQSAEQACSDGVLSAEHGVTGSAVTCR